MQDFAKSHYEQLHLLFFPVLQWTFVLLLRQIAVGCMLIGAFFLVLTKYPFIPKKKKRKSCKIEKVAHLTHFEKKKTLTLVGAYKVAHFYAR